MRRSVLLVASVTFAVLLACGVALAAEITCPTGENGLCVGTTGADTIIGTTAVDTIRALGGNDVLVGGAGRDKLNGGSGNDRYVFRNLGDFPPADTPASREAITADESGVDTLDFSRLPESASACVIQFVDTGDVRAYYEPCSQGDWHIVEVRRGDIETFLGGRGDERVEVDFYGPLVLRLGPGDDTFIFRYGNTQDDWVYGGPGNDSGNAFQGNDKLFGAKGNDSLQGRLGNDLVDGGPGADDLQGGGNGDILSAADGEADVLIDCGGAINDRVYYDEGLDPEPVGCEVQYPQ